MKAASLNDIKKELQQADADILQELCLKLAKFKKENKELLTYLLYEAGNETGYIQSVKTEMDDLFTELPSGVNSYFIKKNLRKILRFANRQIKYSGVKQTELEIRIYFCEKMRDAKVPRQPGTVLGNIYSQQVNKIMSVFEKLPEDLQADYEREIHQLN